MRAVATSDAASLASAPAHLWEQRAALCFTVLSLLILILIGPRAGESWATIPAFVPAYQAAVALNDLVTAALLLGLSRGGRWPLLLLAAGYLYTALLAVAHALSFPGAFAPAGLFGGPQTTIWLWLFWHLPFPVVVLTYALTSDRSGEALKHDAGTLTPVTAAVVTPGVAAGACILLTAVWHDALPPLMSGNGYIPGVTRPILTLPFFASLLALAALVVRTRLRRSLDLWLAVALGAWAVEVLLSALLNTGRFQAGFYVGRLYGLFASSAVLVSLLLATAALQRRLVHSLAGERDLAQAELQERETRLRFATEHAEIGLWDVDLVNDTLMWPPRVKAMFGISANVPVSLADFYAGLHPDDAAATAAAFSAAADPDRRALYDVEFRAVGKEDGTVRWVAAKGRGIFDDTGRCVRVIGTAIDISARKEAEQILSQSEVELRRLNEDLESRVAEEIAAREAAQAQLAHAQRMEALGQLAGGIAHDINNVLQAAGGGAALIERRPGDPEAVRRLARMVVEATERGSAVTRRLLAFSRRGDLRAEALDPLALLTDMREILTHTLGAGIGVRVEALPGLPLLLADKSQLETVVVNLAANARDAMDGHGIITLGALAEIMGEQRRRHDPTSPKPGAYVRLSVSDTGKGMAPEVLVRAAEPFFTTKERGKGTGLGLAMARGFTEQSGGALRIESAPHRGTTVLLWFPMAAAAATPRMPAEAAAPGLMMADLRRILLVDDDAVVREITAEGLEVAGFAVLTATDGASGLALLDAGEAVDLLVCDFSMPAMDGVAVIREAQSRRPGLPAILLTGFATNAAELAIGGAVSGTFSLLRKPITATQLAERIAVLLEGTLTTPGGRH